MRKALIISLVVHLATAFLSVRLHKISRVDFVERDVYTVQIVTPVEAAEQKVERKPDPPAPEPVKEEDIAPPEETKPKPKPEPPKKKVIPSTNITKTKEQKTSPDSTALAPTAITGDIALDVEDFPFAYYLSTIKTKIAGYWRVPGTTSETIVCRVYFRIDRNGAVRSTSIETSSGNILFDQAAQRAVIQANPLPPLPQGFGDDYLGVHFSFAYEED